jgi:nitrous oxide reductase accessory protein NosL
MSHRALLAAAAVLAAAAASAGGEAWKPGPRDKCPVCGMFVARYPDWIATADLADGSRAVFDGSKDLFKFLSDPGKFLPGRTRAQVKAVTVTDYYTLAPVDAREAFFVLGGDVLGPMGRELVPFARREAAEEFRRDHRGTRILAFGEVTPDLVRSLDG